MASADQITTPQVEAPEPINRDLSWLEFNGRVLAQAEDDRLPLLERVKFCAIFASNLDEFYMKRVGLAKRRLARDSGARTREGIPMTELLARIRDRVDGQQERLAAAWLDAIKPALAAEGIRIAKYADLSAAQQQSLDDWFDAEVFPVLTPLAVDPSHRFPFISNLSENFGVMLTRALKKGDENPVFARVKIPSVVPRYVRVPPESGDGGIDSSRDHTLIPLDELLGSELDRLFPGMQIEEVAPFRLTRSAAVDPEEDEATDVLEHVEDELRRRRFADPVRLEASLHASGVVLDFVTSQLGLDEADVYRRPGPLEYTDLFEIASLPRGDLKREPWTPVVPPALQGLPDHFDGQRIAPSPASLIEGDGPSETIFDRIRADDILVHHPYESFDHSVERFIEEAAADPDVLAIKQTIYRTSPDSPFVDSLARAAEAGKNVAALVELRARFDEQRNVVFARRLEESGVHVAYGVVGLKTHCKLSLVVRREGEKIRTYAHIGTGNYHPKTAQLYTDLGLLTTRANLTSDAVRVFNTLTGHAAEQHYDRFLVAPHQMRTRFAELIDQEIAGAQAGRPARIVCKMNQLEDPQIIEKLYEASQAGVPIRCFVRGFCCLRPGVEGVSDNIQVISVVGRLLEHARVFHFASGRDDPREGTYFMGSADWMSRNLSDRLEVATPVDKPELKERLWRILDVMGRDRRNAWQMRPDGRYERLQPRGDEPPDDPAILGTFQTLMRDALASQHRVGGEATDPQQAV